MLYYNVELLLPALSSCPEAPPVASSSRPRRTSGFGATVDFTAIRMGAACLRGRDHRLPLGGGSLGDVV